MSRRYGRHQPKPNEKPSAFVKRVVREQAQRQTTGQPYSREPAEPVIASGPDCPTCRGRKACDDCGYQP